MIGKKTALIMRMLFVILLLTGAYVFAMFQGGMASWTIFYFLLPFALYSFCVLFYPLRNFTVTRVVQPNLIGSGESTLVTIQVKRTNRFPLLYVVIHDVTRESFGELKNRQNGQLAVLGFRKQVEYTYEIVGKRRGEHRFSPVHIEVTDFFGWIKKTKSMDTRGDDSLLIYPKTVAMSYVPIGSNYERGAASSPFSFVKETTVATSVRNYEPGDRFSWIHWKSFARTQTLMTKEFENKRGEHTTLLLDTRFCEAFEEQVQFTASVLKEAADRHADLGFATMDAADTAISEIAGNGQLRKAMIQLARLVPQHKEKVETPNYATLLQRTGAVVVISGNPDVRLLRPILSVAKSQPVHCFVVLNDEAQALQRMNEQLQELRALGVRVHLLGESQFERSFQEVAWR